MTHLVAIDAQKFFDIKEWYVKQAHDSSSGWVGFLDGLSEMESGGVGGYGASNQIKGVSIAFNFPKSCHVVHALN